MSDPIEVTEENFGDLLIEGLREAVAIERGELKPARVSRRKITARRTEVAPPPRYDAKRILTVRKRMNVSQPVFARILNVSDGTVRSWEQGVRTPEGATLRLLEIAEKHPEAITGGVQTKARRTRKR